MPAGPVNEQEQKQWQGQNQSTSVKNRNTVTGSSESSSTSSNDGNSQSINVSSPDDIKIRNVASPGTPNSYPTAPCRVARSGGLSLPGGALSGGGSVEDVECTLRETARSFGALGVPEVGLHLLCTNSHVINGVRNKKGKLAKGSPTPMGSDACLRLVREFQGAPDEVEQQSLASELESVRHNHKLLEEELATYRQECSDSADRSFKACQEGVK